MGSEDHQLNMVMRCFSVCFLVFVVLFLFFSLARSLARSHARSLEGFTKRYAEKSFLVTWARRVLVLGQFGDGLGTVWGMVWGWSA